MSKEQTLVSVSLFYKNDKANGFGVSLHPSIYEAVKVEAETAWSGMRYEFCNDDALAAYLIDQLKALGELKNAELSTAQQTLAIMNIILLTERGYIANDDFNGVLLAYSDADKAADVLNALYS